LKEESETRKTRKKSRKRKEGGAGKQTENSPRYAEMSKQEK
jgi:hypothetical protein